jgi:hypothetical protein
MKKQKLIRAGALALAIIAGLTPAEAHHSFAMYDLGRTMVKTGVVVRTTPDPWHFQFFFAALNEERNAVVRDESGQPVIYQIEMATAALMAAAGITPDTFPPGTIVSIAFYPLRNGKPGGARGEYVLYRCPPKTPPAAGAHCDSVEGSTKFGEGELPKI